MVRVVGFVLALFVLVVAAHATSVATPQAPSKCLPGGSCAVPCPTGACVVQPPVIVGHVAAPVVVGEPVFFRHQRLRLRLLGGWCHGRSKLVVKQRIVGGCCP